MNKNILENSEPNPGSDADCQLGFFEFEAISSNFNQSIQVYIISEYTTLKVIRKYKLQIVYSALQSPWPKIHY